MPANSSFNHLIHLTDREIQTFLREVDQKDLAYSLKGARKDVREKFSSNMSKRVRQFIEEEIELSKPRSETVNEVRGRVMNQVKQLAEQGQIAWPPVEKLASQPKVKKKKLNKKYLDGQRQLKQQVKKSLSELSYDEVDSLFVAMSERARKEGIMALESMAQGTTDPFIKAAVQLAVDGTDPALIMDILKSWMESLLHEQETKYKKVIEAIMAIQSGDNPRIVEFKLEVIY
jgi:hypothetical protein